MTFTAFILIPSLCVLSLLIGSSSMNVRTLIDGLLFYNIDSSQIVYSLRLPRLLLCILAGISLSISGFLMQTVSQNKLVSPSMIGLVDGALLGVVIARYFSWHFVLATPLSAVMGSLFTIALVYGLAALIPNGFIKTRFVLLGIVISNIVGSLANLLSVKISFFQESNLYFLGTVSDASWWDVLLILASILVVLPFFIYLLSQLDGFFLDEDLLYGLGKPVKQIKILAFLVATLLSAVTISVVGKINFVGLIVPNMAYFFRENKVINQLWMTIIISAELMLVSDLLSKLIRYPYETPISFVISFIGIPFFFYILKKQGGENA